MKQRKVGTVVKISGIRTVRVMVEWSVAHPLYHKRYKKSAGFLVDTGTLEPQLGDKVEIQPIARVSKNKSWQVTRVLTNTTKGSTNTVKEVK